MIDKQAGLPASATATIVAMDSGFARFTRAFE